MTDFSRLTNWIIDYFPEPKYSQQDITKWANKNVPAWNYIDDKSKSGILKDWENFIYEKKVEPIVESWVKRWSSGFIERIRNFLGRLF